MEQDRYVLRQRTSHDPETADARIREALTEEGFGVLTEIDVTTVLQNKLGVEVAPYRILGACKPSYAHRAIDLDPAIGGLLPCNVVVRAHPDGGSEVIAVDPVAMMGLSGSSELEEVAAEIEAQLRRALEAACA